MYRPAESSEEVPLELVDRWLIRACHALLTNWDESASNFWRDSWETRSDTLEGDEQHPAGLGPGKGSTSNNRAFQSLISAAYYFDENDDIPGAREIGGSLKNAARSMVLKYFMSDLDILRSHGENRQNPYTDAQLALSMVLALSPATSAAIELQLSNAQRIQLTNNLLILARRVGEDITRDGVKVHESARAHHFLTLHNIRALDAAKRLLDGTTLKGAPRELDIETSSKYPFLVAQIRDEIIRQLGLHLLPAPGFDSSSLVSSCALTARFTGDADSPLVREAVTALVEDQSTRGTWTSAGVLSFGRRRLVYMPSIELSLVLANLVLGDLRQSDLDLFERSLPALDASFRLVQSSYARHGKKSGWRNDRTQSGYEVESWTTGVVVQYLISYREALTLSRQERVLRKYRARRQPTQFENYWADLSRLTPLRKRMRILLDHNTRPDSVAHFTSLIDPTSDNSIVQGISDEILFPTITSLHERPMDTASFLLFGPPGTRKTSLVEHLANDLGWPIMVLSPPAFLRHGIEGFEAAADESFEDLMHLKRVVVLFDECEEFFRWRPNPTSIENRTIGAFITAGMLPRLQRLREARWLVFVINTNVEAFELDDAVTRRGRLDKVARVGHPELGAQIRYLSEWKSRTTRHRLGKHHLRWFSTHLAVVEDEMEPHRRRLANDRKQAQLQHPERGEGYRNRMAEIQIEAASYLRKVVTFTALDRLAERCIGEGAQTAISSSESLRKNLDEEFERFGPDSFTPNPAWRSGWSVEAEDVGDVQTGPSRSI